MKKKFAATLAASFIMGVSSITFASSFNDVPADHWAHNAVKNLAEAGIIDGYNDNTYRGDKMITRYEMAQLVDNAMKNLEKATPDQKATLAVLKSEFADELKALDNRVSVLEKVKFSGFGRVQYENIDNDTATAKNSGLFRFRLNMTSEINDNWSWGTRIENFSPYMGDYKEDSELKLRLAYVKGQNDEGTLTLGRFEADTGFTGLVSDEFIEGAGVTFGNDLQTTLIYGKTRFATFKDNNGAWVEDGSLSSDAYYSVRTKYKSGLTNLYAGYHKNEAGAANADREIAEVGFSAPIAKNFSVSAEYADAIGSDDKSYAAFLKYKGVKMNTPGSFGINVGAYSIDEGSVIATAGMYSLFKEDATRVQFQYVPSKKVMWDTWYDMGEDNDAIRSKLTFMF